MTPERDRARALRDGGSGERVLAVGVLALLTTLASVARADDAPAPATPAAPSPPPSAPPLPADHVVDHSIDRFRSPVEALTEGMIGSASRPVRFDWRRSTVTLGAVGSDLIELNNFQSFGGGVFAKKAFGDLLGDIAVTWIHTTGSDSTDKLALTPYRQAGRPDRIEIDVNVGYPLVEGVVTPNLLWMPPAEMALFFDGGLRYLLYPWALGGLPAFSLTEASIGTALVAPALTDIEVANLEPSRLPGMEIDRGRYGALAGFELDVWLQPGVVVAPRAMLALPLVSLASGSKLGWWWELSLSVGYAL